MNWVLSARIAGIVTAVILVTGLQQQGNYAAVVVSLGFTHYILAFYYARKRMLVLARTPELYLPVLSLIVACTLIYIYRLPLELYFGVHHAFNEGYLRRFGTEQNNAADNSLAPAKAFLHAAVYFFILRNAVSLRSTPDELLCLWLVVAYLLLWTSLKKTGGAVNFKRFCKTYQYELLMLLVVLASFYVRFTFLQVVLYHFVAWAILPIKSLQSRGGRFLQQYVGLTVAILGVFLVFTLPGQFRYSVNESVMMDQFYVWSYIHISASLALSSTHPDWVVQLFVTKKAV